MTGEYDAQLLESVGVRRQRLGGALLHGRERTRRGADRTVKAIVAGLAVAAVLCAGCVGWSYVQERLGDARAGATAGAAATAESPATATASTSTGVRS